MWKVTKTMEKWTTKQSAFIHQIHCACAQWERERDAGAARGICVAARTAVSRHPQQKKSLQSPTLFTTLVCGMRYLRRESGASASGSCP